MDDQPRNGRSGGGERPDDATEVFRADDTDKDTGDADADPTAVVPPPDDSARGGGGSDRASSGDAGAGDHPRGGAGPGDNRDADATERIDMDHADLDEPTRTVGDVDTPTEAMRGDIDSPTEAVRGDVDSPTEAMRGDGMSGPIDPDATRAVGPPDPDATQYIPPGQPISPRPPDQTQVAPPQGWVGHAQVRPRDPEDDPNAVWVPVGSQRAWWLPILLGVLGLLLILGIVYGLIVASRNNNPAPTQTPTVPTTPATPTTTPPTTSAPTSSAPTSNLVTIPANLTQLDINAATQTLQALGLVADPKPRTVTDPNQVNRVLDTEPAPGSQVPVGSKVTLVYGQLAAPPPSAPPPSSPPPPSPSPS